MEMIIALIVLFPFVLFFWALFKGVEEGVLRHYQDDVIINEIHIEEDDEEDEDQYLLDQLVEFYDTHGRLPKAADLRPGEGYPSALTYRRRFGSLAEAIELAGLPVENEENNANIR